MQFLASLLGGSGNTILTSALALGVVLVLIVLGLPRAVHAAGQPGAARAGRPQLPARVRRHLPRHRPAHLVKPDAPTYICPARERGAPMGLRSWLKRMMGQSGPVIPVVRLHGVIAAEQRPAG